MHIVGFIYFGATKFEDFDIEKAKQLMSSDDDDEYDDDSDVIDHN